MRKLLITVLIAMGILAFSVQPMSSYWFVEDLKNWSPEKDKDADFNRGMIPLAERKTGEIINSNARDEAQVMALSIMYPMTSKNPSEGAKEFDVYNFQYWQYIDKLVMWGGSAGEGIILSPSSDVINAAHKNGVKVYGTVFFPPNYYGGQLEWLSQFLEQREDGSFLVADKLIEVANYYNFDGWFINQELKGATKEQAKKMQEFLSYFNDNKKDYMEVIWYDSMNEDGEIDYQNHLTDKNDGYLVDDGKKLADSMFLNFWWKDQSSTKKYALNNNIDPYINYAGIDVQANGFNTKASWEGLFPENKEHNVSLGLYCPNWTYSSSESVEEYTQKANIFWVGANKNPLNTESEYDWKGIANYIPAKTTIINTPFVTNFNTGNGYKYAVFGEIVSENPWHNRSLQDILPTWRWYVEGNQVKVNFDWDKPYYGGSSLKLESDLNESSKVYLYKTDIKLYKGSKISATFNTNLNNIAKLGIMFEDKSEVLFDLDNVAQTWTRKDFNLNDYAGKSIKRIFVYLKSDDEIDDFYINLGSLSVLDKGSSIGDFVIGPKNLEITEYEFVDGIFANLRLKWDTNQEGLLYEIYRVVDGKKEYLGSTYNNVFYIDMIKRISAKEKETKIIVEPVSKMLNHGDEAEVIFEWGEYPKPTADLYVDRTFIAPGDTIEFINKSKVYDRLKWFFVGGNPIKSTEENPNITYDREGEFRVTLIAYNEVGRDTLVKDKMITVSNKAKKEMELVSFSKSATATSNVDGETPLMALDGEQKTKWCAVGDLPHELYVDLGKEQKIGKFILKNAEFGGESADMNTKAYKISISKDGKDWKEVVNIEENNKAIAEHLIEFQRARYVKLSILKATQGNDSAARIYEFEVYAEKNLFDNYAFGKEATASGNVGGEVPAFAFDDKTKDNSKWCVTGEPPHWIMVDLGQIEVIDKFILKNAEEGGESPEWNTSDYYIEVSSDKENWTKVVDVQSNDKAISEHIIKPVKGRYARLTVTKPTQGGDTAVRLYEFQVLGYKTHKSNKAADKQATATGFVPGEIPNYAFDRDISTKWCATGSEPHEIIVDLEKEIEINKFVIKHAQEGGESEGFNTKIFKIFISDDKENWTEVVNVENNEKGVSEHVIKPVKSRYVKLSIIKATQNDDTAARIYEFEVHGN
ncbi:discoidin domain-containing protein [Oceanotoga sp. DSM 15011]|uniref:endo-beta-N-acetylglucosaminidase n=2 Tax=Bacteria TaxID=2 RepID=UPI0021F4BC20|nr:discoidin domain-containing protein [Oceanotoga sp. DSM 15011]UYO99228.1 discoidin domain-containing protein [Oceanotoga sp. DSM 15011]